MRLRRAARIAPEGEGPRPARAPQARAPQARALAPPACGRAGPGLKRARLHGAAQVLFAIVRTRTSELGSASEPRAGGVAGFAGAEDGGGWAAGLGAGPDAASGMGGAVVSAEGWRYRLDETLSLVASVSEFAKALSEHLVPLPTPTPTHTKLLSPTASA